MKTITNNKTKKTYGIWRVTDTHVYCNAIKDGKLWGATFIYRISDVTFND